MSVIVFGSINMDLVVRAPRLPIPGETLRGQEFFTAPGGKGANQAVAIARLGIATQMVGRLGKDAFGKELLQSLETAGVETRQVLVDEAASSGVALIAVDSVGENQIIIVPGANGQVNETDVERLRSVLPGKIALLLQLEIPLPVVLSAAQAATAVGVPVVLDPAPAQLDLPAELYSLVDVMTPNEVEAEQLVGFPVDSIGAAAAAAKILRQRGVRTVIVKLGAQGALCATATATFVVSAFPVVAVDTVAAGDAFNGGLTAALVEKLSWRQAVIWGAAAGAIACTQVGAQSAMSDRRTFDLFLQQHTTKVIEVG